MKKSFTLLAILAAGVFGLSAPLSAALVLEYTGSNYSITNNGNGTSTATWVNSGTAGTTYNGSNTLGNSFLDAFPTVNPNATPNGSQAVGFGVGAFGGRYEPLANPFAVPTAFSIFAVISTPTLSGSGINGQTIFSTGANGGAAFRLEGGSNQLRLTRAGVADAPLSSVGVSINTWTVIGLTYDGSTGAYAYYINGVNVGSGTQSLAFNQPFQLIGTGVGNSLPFRGQMAALQLYSTALDSTAAASLSTALNNAYVIPEPATWGLLGMGLTALLVFRRRSARQS